MNQASIGTGFDRQIVNQGFKELSLCEQIQTILQQYPDDGQILKEIIQNAEDAGASEVKFLLDLNQYPSNSLIKPAILKESETNKLQDYQGPALLSFNDGLFQTSDWNKGILNMYKSVKRDDPLKVGRFGLGFKSVFHITDFPSLISGKGIAFMDPHKQFFTKPNSRGGHESTSTFIFDLEENRDEILAARDQWSPYKHSVLGRDGEGFESGNFYNGTLFRFPLRNSSNSDLSETIYTPERVFKLFETIKKEGHLYLLFLKSVESIQLCSTKNGTMQMDFEVCLSDSCRASVTEAKNQLMTNILAGVECHVAYNVEIEVRRFSNNRVVQTDLMSFEICQYYRDNSIPRLQILADKLKVNPLVGVAYPLNQLSASIGSQVFCFLPLTIEEANSTGLPVHVNGYFSVDNNRKHLKKQSVSGDSRDEGAEWNLLLADHVLSKALFQLVLNAISQNRLTRDQIYSMFPNPSTINSYWTNFVINFYKSIQSRNIIRTETNWCSFSQAMVTQPAWSPQFTELAKRILKYDSKLIAEIPEHISNGFKSYCRLNAKESSVTDVSQSFARVQNSYSWSDNDRLDLLFNILQSRSYSSVLGLCLLKLENGNWIQFNRPNISRVIYLENGAHVKNVLIGNVNDRFINSNSSAQFNPSLPNLLQALAGSNVSQLKLFSPQYFQQELASLMRTPPSYHSDPDYSQRLWTYLYHNFPYNLNSFAGLYLLPVNSSEFVRLPSTSEAVIQNNGGGITAEEKQLMTSLGISVLGCVDECASRHHQLPGLIFSSNTDGKLAVIRKCFNNIGANQFTQRVSQLAPNLKIALRYLLSTIPHYQIPNYKQLLISAPVFETLPTGSANPTFVSAQTVRSAAPDYDYVLPLPNLLINKDAPHSEPVLRMTGYITTLSVPQVLAQMLNVSICHHPVEKIEQFVDNCLTMARNNSNLNQLLSKASFVRTISRGVVRPNLILDPRDEKVQSLFVGDDYFPLGKFSSVSYLDDLKRLGMRNIGALLDSEVVSVAKSIHNNSSGSYSKSKALLNYFQDYPSMWNRVKGSLSSYSWIPVLQQPPANYPKDLNWNGSDCFTENLVNVKSHDSASLCGSRCRIVALPTAIVQNRPSLDEVCAHLVNCKQFVQSMTAGSHFTPSAKANFLQILDCVYQYFQTQCSSVEVLKAVNDHDIDNWLFIEDKFVSPTQCCFEKTFANFSPFVYTVPAELSHYRSLLTECGVSQTCSYVKILNQLKEQYDEFPDDIVNKERDLNYATMIINHLSKVTSFDCQELVLPIAGDSLKFLPLQDCSYCDIKMHEKGINLEDLTEENIYLIHPDISSQIAEDLGVPSLMSALLSNENFGFDTGFGQSEPLTTRLKNLLREYRDGLAVLKEMIQNADDAGASVVKLVYDERGHEDHQTNLFDDNMKSLQGPALLSYNDAIFTEEDFQNIVKLGGATKEKVVDKVGRFGLGFNSVYNLTEVPSFISANNIVFFDPHRKYLGKAMRDKEQPGIKLNLTRRMVQRQLALFSDQFHPLNGLFGCDLNPTSPTEYFNGTLFRLPLRSSAQASTSELVDNSDGGYSHEKMKDLFKMFYENRHSLLLFTQNVQLVEVFSLKSGVQLIPLFSVKKEVAETVDSLSKQDPSGRENILRSTKQIMSARMAQLNQSTTVLHSVVAISEQFKNDYWKKTAGNEEKRFIITSSSGTKESFNFALKEKEFLPIGGVALEVDINCRPILAERPWLFCFLPLPIESKFAFHINGYFAVSSNRTELYSSNHQDKKNKYAEWNELVMSDPVTESCFRCLHVLKDKWTCFNPEDWYNVWPVHADSDSECSPKQMFVKSFYEAIVRRNTLCHFVGENGSSSFSNCVFLEPEFENCPIGDIARSIFTQVIREKDPGKVVVSIPRKIIDSCLHYCDQSEICHHQYSRERFYREVVFPNIDAIDPQDYSTLILWTLFHLDSADSHMMKLLKENSCIPASGAVRKFLKPQQLVDPNGKLGVLFTAEDGRFPFWNKAEIGKALKNFKLSKNEVSSHIFDRLRILGMVHNSLPWCELIERSETVILIEPDLGMKRSQCLIELIKEMLKGKSLPNPEEKSQLLSTPFLPVLKSDLKTPLPWNSGHCDSWCSAKVGFSEESKNLVFCSSPVIVFKNKYSGAASYNTFLEFLELYEKPISKDIIDQQLTPIVDFIRAESFTNDKQKSELKTILSDILSHLDIVLSENQYLNTTLNLKEEPIVYFDAFHRFVKPLECVKTGPSFPPFIFSIGRMISEKFQHLFDYLEIKESSSARHYVDTLKRIHDEHVDNTLSDTILKTCINIIMELCKCIGRENIEVASLETEVHAPDSKKRIQPASKLCINLSPWLEDVQFQYIHGNISYEQAILIGVKDDRSQLLSRYQLGIPFGQKEKLSRRIKMILSGYPFDESIMKELLQNADDAGAQQLHFILDSKHYGKNSLFSDTWSHLQGPALLVYNDKPFTQSDLAAIQNLGEGNKHDDPIKTGQYGVGFNCVYHLTDCPTFLTTIEEEGECLCAFDPLLKYIPGATENRPGQRFNDISQLEKRFPDVFECYRAVQRAIGKTDGTLFRLPLRSKESAECCPLVTDKEEVTIARIKDLFSKIFPNIAHYLLFLRNVKSVIFSEMQSDGKLKVLVRSDTSLEDSLNQKLIDFNDHMKSEVISLKESKLLQNVAFQELSYTLHVRTTVDTKTTEDEWLIEKRFGFQTTPDPSEEILKEYQNGNLGVLPLAGLAVPLIPRGQMAKDFNLFCLLPLPIKSKFPLHINGYFALNYENRRGLSVKTIGKQWNTFLLGHVVAPLYLSLLETLKTHVSLQSSYNKLKSSEAWYFKHIPSFNEKENELSHLTQELYTLLGSTDMKLYPMVKKCGVKGDNFSVLSWHSLSPEIVFNTLHAELKKLNSQTSQSSLNYPHSTQYTTLHRQSFQTLSNVPKEPDEGEVLTDLLKSFDMILIDCPARIIRCFQLFKVTITVTEPGRILNHFSSHPTCQSIVGKELKETPFNTFKVLKLMFDFVFNKTTDAKVEIQNAPLMVSCYQIVRRLCSSTPIFSDNHSQLIPSRGDLFAYPGLVSYEMETGLLKSYIRNFTLEDLSRNLPEVLLKTEFCVDSVAFEKLKNNTKESWFTLVWKFILSSVAKSGITQNKAQKQQFLSNALGSWCLFPVFQNKRALLLPIKHTKHVLDLAHSSTLQQMALRKLNVYEPNYLEPKTPSMFQPSLSGLKELIGQGNIPDDVFNALKLVSDTFPQSLSKQEAKDLCYSISSWLRSNKKLSCWRNLITQIPMFEDVCGKVKSVGHCSRIHTLPSDMPTAGMDKWYNDRYVFLTDNSSYDSLYKLIGCTPIDLGDVYVDLILPKFTELPTDAQMKHLEFLRNKSQNDKIWKKINRSNEILLMLRDTAFILDKDKTLYKPGHFYDHREKLFEVMVPDRLLPRNPFSTYWCDFLVKLGLIDKLSEEDCLRFAEMISNSPDVELKSNERSLQLVRVIFNQHEKNLSLLQRMKSIPFLCPGKVGKKLLELAPPFTSETSLIPFENSACSSDTELIWSQCNILQCSYSPRKHLRPKDVNVESTLGILYNLPDEKVCHHLLTVCSNKKIDNSEFLNVLTKIFKHLQQASLSSDLTNLLKTKSIIPLENDPRLIQPIHLVTRDLTEKQEIVPHLCRLMPSLGEFEKLFIRLGAQNALNTNSFAEVLYQMRRISKGQNLEPNEIDIVVKATVGFFQQLSETDFVLLRDKLYLPSSEKRLHVSSELVYIDDPSLKERIECLDEPIFYPLDKQFNFVLLFDKFPEAIRPIFLTDILNEEIEAKDLSDDTNHIFNEIRRRLKSKIFINAIIRLSLHFKIRAQPAEFDYIKHSIQDLKIIPFTLFTTFLVYKSQTVPKSQKKHNIYLSNEGECWIIYLQANPIAKSQPLIQFHLVQYLLKVLDLKQEVYAFLNLIFEFPDEEIDSQLDKLKIKEYGKMNSGDNNFVLPCGGCVPENLLDMLSKGLDDGDIKVGTKVAYQSFDPIDEDKSIYVLAKLLKVNDGDQLSGPICEIDLGNGKTEDKPLKDLFRFKRSNESDDFDEENELDV